MAPHSPAEYEAAKMLLELSKDNTQSLVEMKTLLERKERQVVSLCRSAIDELKTGSLYINTSDQLPSSDMNLNTFDTERNISDSFQVNSRTDDQNFGKIGAGDFASSGNTDNAFVKGTPLRRKEIKNNINPISSDDNIEEKQRILKEVYIRVTTLLSRASVNGESLKDKMVEANLMPVHRKINENLQEMETNEQDTRMYQTKSGRRKAKNNKKSLTHGNHSSENENLINISIGSGYTTIPAKKWYNINWNSYTIATRTLLCAVFPREILATHSLTGKSSPAFSHKPPKQRLNPKIINDIVETVATRCKVSRSLVRTAITIKCADEAKSQRIRAGKLEQSRLSNIQENSPSVVKN